MKVLTVNGGSGVAEARLYDDGWRIEGVYLTFATEVADLKAEERVQLQKELGKVAGERSHEKVRLEELIRKAKQPTKSLLQVSEGLTWQSTIVQDVKQLVLTDVAFQVTPVPVESYPGTGDVRSYWFWYVRQVQQNAASVSVHFYPPPPRSHDVVLFWFKGDDEARAFSQTLEGAVKLWRSTNDPSVARYLDAYGTEESLASL